ncbi:MAG TPA: glycoside hydrolase domain-containing protein [Mycobacteriales bacterium]|nr:glycoside hydrolase domain-containing protein [Mycobacteriales bacterium]
MSQEWSFVTTDSLEKVYPDGEPRPIDRELTESVFLGETASVQIAFRPPAALRDPGPIRFHIRGESSRFTTLYDVELVPCAMPAFPGHDGGYDRDVPGLYPDLLRPSADGLIQPLFGAWRSVWIDLRVDDPGRAGTHQLELQVTTADGNTVLYDDVVSIEVLPHRLPALEIGNTHWFHCDGLATYYGVPVFSEEHWRIVDDFIAAAAEMGATSLLTPTWTPPLDTAVGHTRVPVQLIGIAYADSRYTFDFQKLGRWLQLCEKHGLAAVEIAHLFTQWGAQKTPAIYVEQDGTLQHRFGWHVDATDPAYRELLEQLIPQLREFLAAHWPGEVIYHISDEPHGAAALDTYRAARAVVADLLEGTTVVDALSDFDFYSSGAVPIPVVATDAVAPFLSAGVDTMWVYYCVSQNKDVANRFIALPSLRNRVIGHQLFAFEAKGFLHWGFNFYNSYHSLRPIDPFRDTCGAGAFPGGDPFIVYPGEGGRPWPSIRFKVFAAAMADYRAMQALRDVAGRDAVMELIDTDGSGGRLAFDRFSYDPGHYRRVRAEINQRIANAEPVRGS